MTVGGLDDLINLISDGLEVVLAVVIGNRHSLGDIQPCVVCVIEGRFSTGLEEQTMRNEFQAVFRFEVFEVRSVRDCAGGQHMAHITIPHLTAEDVIDILGSAAQRQNTVFIRVQPNGGLARFVDGSNGSFEITTGNGDTVIALDFHTLNLVDEVHDLVELRRLERRQRDNVSSFFFNVAVLLLAEAIEQGFALFDEACKEFLVLISVSLGRAKDFDGVHIAEDVLLADSFSEGVLGCFLEFMGFIHHHKTTLTEQGRMIIGLRLLGHKVHIVVRYLEVQIGKIVHSLCELVIHAFFLSSASSARSLDADSTLDCSADAISVQVDPCTKVSHLLEQFNGSCVFLGVQANILEEIIEAITAEVVFLAFAEYRS